MLTNQWIQDFEYEMRLAEAGEGNQIQFRTAEDIKNLATELYEFVQDKS